MMSSSLVALLPQPAANASPSASDGTASVCISLFLDGSADDATLAVRRALAYCKRAGIARLTFPPRHYFFTGDHACEQTCFISNNDSGIKRIAFLINGFRDFEIDGCGAHFVFRGFVIPFLIENSERIVIKNLTLNYERTFHSEGRIIALGKDSVDVSFSTEYPYKITHNLLTFVGKPGDEKTEYPAWSILEFDALKRETAYMARDYYFDNKRHAKELSPGHVRVRAEGIKASVGNILVFGAAGRNVPGIVIQDSNHVKICGVTLFHAGGMGVIAQRSSTIELRDVNVTPGRGRMLSTTADATHFVNCSGTISLIDCVFENQLDDATNIHGIYMRISRKVSPTELEVQLVHPQQFGVDVIRPGSLVELVKRESLRTVATCIAKSMERLNSEYSRITLSKPCPEELEINDLVGSAECAPEVLIKGCTIRNNRARGILLGSPGVTVVEDNRFHSPGAAILLEGDGSFWFEQAGVHNLAVRRNVFDNCNFGVWGKAVIEVGAGIDKAQRADCRYNCNIVVEENLFRVFDAVPLIHGYSIGGLTMKQNRIEITEDYPVARTATDCNRYEITDSSDVHIEE